MVITTVLTFTLAIISLGIGILLLVRNNRVGNFRTKIIDMVYRGDNWMDKQKIYHNGPTYDEMLCSIKPLKLESFYTPRQIEILTK